MSKAKHTPGPWVAGRAGGFSREHVFTEAGDMIADCCHGTRLQGQANARLIAAAPDLLEAVRLTLRTLDGYRDADKGETHHVTLVMDKARAESLMRAAIAKATAGT